MFTDEQYMEIALQQAELAAECGEVPVGAVLVLPDGQQFVAHNAPISNHDATAHAEIHRTMYHVCRSYPSCPNKTRSLWCI